MASSLLALLTQHTPELQTRKALIVLGLQNDFISPEGKLPVDLASGFLDHVKSLVPAFREHGEIIWVRSRAPPTKDVDGHGGDAVDAVITASSTAPDDTRTIKSGAKRGAINDGFDNATAVKRVKAGKDELDPELFLSSTATREACCIRDTWGAEHPDHVKTLMAKKDLHIVKESYSAFASTSLLTMLRIRLITEVYICGCMTNLSVYATAMDAATHGIQITLVEDALGYRQRTRHDEAVRKLKNVMSAEVINSDKVVDRLRNPITSEEDEASELSEDDEETAELTALSQTSENKTLSVTSIIEADDSLAADSEDDDEEIELPQVCLPRTRFTLPLRYSSLLARNSSPQPAPALEPTAQHSQPASVGTTALAASDALDADVDSSPHGDGHERLGVPITQPDHLEPNLELTSDSRVKEEPLSRIHDDQQKGPLRGNEWEEKVLEASSAGEGCDAHEKIETLQVESEAQHPDAVSTGQHPLCDIAAADTQATEEQQTGTDEICPSQRHSIDPDYRGPNSSEPTQDTAHEPPLQAVDLGEKAVKVVTSDTDTIESRAKSPHQELRTTTDDPQSTPDTLRTMPDKASQDAAPRAVLDEAFRSPGIITEHETKPLFGEGAEVASAGSKICYGLLPPELSETIFDLLHKEVEWQTMHHQTGQVPRLVCCQGTIAEDGSSPVYRHPSDQTMPLQTWSATVKLVQEAAEKLVGHPLNHALIQLYRGGTDYISEHSDKTLDIAKGSQIVNASFGAQRTMRLRTKRAVQDITSKEVAPAQRTTHRTIMPHNSCIIMTLPTNAEYLHGINADKRPSVELGDAEKAYDGQRISLTFRHIATFLSADEKMIWGQGATAKIKDEARAVINADAAESERLIKAFGAENQASSIDWDAVYGGGSDVLHIR